MIPKIIIQTGPSNLPLLLQSAVSNVKLLHPDFDYCYFDDADIERFLAEFFPEYVEDYQSFPFRIQRYDFFRYLAVYQFGGFYLDTDVFLVRSLTPLLESSCVFSFEELAVRPYFWKHFQMDWQVGNYAFAAEKGHPFLAAVVENCLRAKRDPNWAKPMMEGVPRIVKDDVYVLNTTGPGLVSRTLAENPHLAERMNVLFPADVTETSGWHQFGDYGIHHMGGSWRKQSNVVKRVLVRAWSHWALQRAVDGARGRGKTRSLAELGKASGQRNHQPVAGKPGFEYHHQSVK